MCKTGDNQRTTIRHGMVGHSSGPPPSRRPCAPGHLAGSPRVGRFATTRPFRGDSGRLDPGNVPHPTDLGECRTDPSGRSPTPRSPAPPPPIRRPARTFSSGHKTSSGKRLRVRRSNASRPTPEPASPARPTRRNPPAQDLHPKTPPPQRPTEIQGHHPEKPQRPKGSGPRDTAPKPQRLRRFGGSGAPPRNPSGPEGLGGPGHRPETPAGQGVWGSGAPPRNPSGSGSLGGPGASPPKPQHTHHTPTARAPHPASGRGAPGGNAPRRNNGQRPKAKGFGHRNPSSSG
ncbi:hypothetical protein Ga0074812_101425 [Parafrankia irregularis]|uniref:Uncharacterized protein n=1 Tax=Parafrankia irregularis TaxID=795642 RepID=A0A0S4QEG5_9ACTN|nr:hypothetical protein Ga0074812_101425 [Parafrankia irregularis]